MSDDTGLRQALVYAQRGWPVFPCLPGEKLPATRHGSRDATTDPERVSRWCKQPASNLAIATGSPGPDVLDVDQHAERAGAEAAGQVGTAPADSGMSPDRIEAAAEHVMGGLTRRPPGSPRPSAASISTRPAP